MKKLLSSDRKTTLLRIAFSIVILSLIISILPARPSYADDGNLPEYRLYPGDIRESANRPDILAYANTEYSMPPPEFTIVTSGTICRYAQWIALVEKGNFIRATTTIDTTSIGVQFWGDTNDGWARVLVDGSEVWRGSIYGTDSNYPGGAFVKYLEISGLAPGKHTISVENMGINGGGGGDDVTIFFFGLRKAPPAPTPPPPPTSQVLNVDVWTNKGGQGSNISGGTFEVGEETVIYVQATSSATGKWSVLGPSMSESGSQELQGGGTYTWELGLAEETDIGEWQVNFEISKDGQYASDTVNFQVISTGIPAPAPAPTPTPAPAPTPTSPTPQPPTGVEEEGTAKIDAASATELDALIALKMAEGELSADLYMDANGDGKITREDASLILEWAVRIHGGLPSAAQQEIIEAIGPPSQFMLTYLLDSDIDPNALVRTEVWLYPERQQKITFIAGEIYSIDDLTPSEEEIYYSHLRPEDFDCFMDYEQVVARIGTGEAEPADFLTEGFEDCGIESYLTDRAVFALESGQLAYLQTFGVEKKPRVVSSYDAGQQFRSCVDNLISTRLICPQPVSAKELPRPLRWLWGKLKKGARFILRLPLKVASIFPKELRPIVSSMIEYKLVRLPAWHEATKIKNISLMEAELAKQKDFYQQQAKKIDEKVVRLKAEERKLEDMRPSELDMTFSQWKARWNLLKETITALEQKSQSLNDRARRANIGDIMETALGGLTKKTLDNIQKVVRQETAMELNKRLGDDAVGAFVEKGDGGLDQPAIRDRLIDGSLVKALKEMAKDPDFRAKIKESVKEQLKEGEVEIRNLDKLVRKTVDEFIAEGISKDQVNMNMWISSDESPFLWASSEVILGADIEVSVQISPAQKTELWMRDSLGRKFGPYYTGEDGKFATAINIPPDTQPGKYEVVVEALKLGFEQSRSITVVKEVAAKTQKSGVDLSKFTGCRIIIDARGYAQGYASGETRDRAVFYQWDADGSFSGTTFNGELTMRYRNSEEQCTGTMTVELEPTSQPDVFKIVSFAVTESYSMPVTHLRDEGSRQFRGPTKPIEASYDHAKDDIFAEVLHEQTCGLVSFFEDHWISGGQNMSITGLRCEDKSGLMINFKK